MMATYEELMAQAEELKQNATSKKQILLPNSINHNDLHYPPITPNQFITQQVKHRNQSNPPPCH